MNRREFLKSAGASCAAAAAGTLGTGCASVEPFEPGSAWRSGDVAHLIPVASHDRIRIKASFRSAHPQPPALRVAGRSVTGKQTDSAARFFVFDVRELDSATGYALALFGADGAPLCDAWPLRTLPAPDAHVERLRVLAYTCAGGSELFYHPWRGRIFLPIPYRQRLLARGLEFKPDVVVANGDHVYWDILSSAGIAMGRSPQAWWTAGRFDRDAPVIGTGNEQVMVKGFGPQIAGVYGTLLRSVPSWFLQDDHDYTENDEASAELRTFPPDAFMTDVARATQHLYYPEFIAPPDLPRAFTSEDDLSRSFGALRYGRLAEALLYDCRGHIENDRDPARADPVGRFVPEEIERWLIGRTLRSDAAHVVHMPSTPVLWTAGKWGEWYPDVLGPDARMTTNVPKPYWSPGWQLQQERLLGAGSARRDRIPLWVSGDLHAIGAGAIRRAGKLDFTANPIVSVLSGPLASDGPSFPSRFRGQAPVPSLTLDAEEWVKPIEANGFTLLDFTPETVRISLFCWQPEDGVDAIARLEPFWTKELRRRTL
jgi:hypothetical protein